MLQNKTCEGFLRWLPKAHMWNTTERCCLNSAAALGSCHSHEAAGFSMHIGTPRRAANWSRDTVHKDIWLAAWTFCASACERCGKPQMCDPAPRSGAGHPVFSDALGRARDHVAHGSAAHSQGLSRVDLPSNPARVGDAHHVLGDIVGDLETLRPDADTLEGAGHSPGSCHEIEHDEAGRGVGGYGMSAPKLVSALRGGGALAVRRRRRMSSKWLAAFRQ